MKGDAARAYEAHAQRYMHARDGSSVGLATIWAWANSLENKVEILELGCGAGVPVTSTLVDAGHDVWAVDSSPTLLAHFRTRFPGIPVECARVQDSRLFDRKFDAVVAIGLMFLLSAKDQLDLIRRVSLAMRREGRFLFTAPVEAGAWTDATTGHMCNSLGRKRYEASMTAAGLKVSASYQDEGLNHYFSAEKASV